jgi:hypothetical protein
MYHSSSDKPVAVCSTRAKKQQGLKIIAGETKDETKGREP